MLATLRILSLSFLPSRRNQPASAVHDFHYFLGDLLSTKPRCGHNCAHCNIIRSSTALKLLGEKRLLVHEHFNHVLNWPWIRVWCACARADHGNTSTWKRPCSSHFDIHMTWATGTLQRLDNGNDKDTFSLMPISNLAPGYINSHTIPFWLYVHGL